MRRSEAAFTLVEILIAGALFVALAFGAFEVVRELALDVPQLRARHLAYAALERVVARMRAEARSATAIWASMASAGAAHDDCVQLDFYAADANGPAFWSYRAFPNHTASEPVPGDALERLTGTAPLAPCDPSLNGEVVLRGLRGAPRLTATAPVQLVAHSDPYLAQADSAFVAASVPPTPPIALGVLDAGGAQVAGGNTLVGVRLDTADGSRAVDLVPGVFANGFTAVLRYTCTERCDVGHDTASPKTLTACAMSWQTQWSEYVTWNDYVTNPNGSLTLPGGWFIAGSFVFTYSGTRASDGGTDTLVRSALATNWDATRDYTAFPPDRAAADGSRSGSFAPWDVRSESAAAWYADLVPYLASGEGAALATERQRCDAVQQQGAGGGFLANG